MKTPYKTILIIGVVLGLCAGARAQSFSFGISGGGYGGVSSIGFSYGYSGGYYAPYCGYSGYPYCGYSYPYYSPYYYGYPYYGYTYYGYGPTCYSYAPAYPVYGTWAPVYAAPVYYPWWGCNSWWSFNTCWGWNNCWYNGCNTGCWNGGGFAVTQPRGPVLPPPTVGLSQTGRVNPGTAGAVTTTGRAMMKAPLFGAGRAATAANGQLAGTPANGYRTIHSLAWNNANRVATSPQTGNASGQIGQSPVKGIVPIKSVGTFQNAGTYQPVRSTGWNPTHANYSVPVRSISPQQPVRTVAYQPVRSTQYYQPAGSSPAWYTANRNMTSPSGARYQQAPTPGWKGANQGVRPPFQSGNYRGYAPSAGGLRPSGGSFRPSGGGNFTGGSSGFSGRSFGGNMGSFGGGGFHR